MTMAGMVNRRGNVIPAAEPLDVVVCESTR
jgi:hypothetical protein